MEFNYILYSQNYVRTLSIFQLIIATLNEKRSKYTIKEIRIIYHLLKNLIGREEKCFNEIPFSLMIKFDISDIEYEILKVSTKCIVCSKCHFECLQFVAKIYLKFYCAKCMKEILEVIDKSKMNSNDLILYCRIPNEILQQFYQQIEKECDNNQIINYVK